MPNHESGRVAVDESQKMLRDALNEAARYVSLKDILSLAVKQRRVAEPGFSSTALLGDRALRNFLSHEGSTLTKANYDVLAATWLSSPIGRTLRKLDPEKVGPFDLLMRTLADGTGTVPTELRVVGQYFMYHGSYLWPDRYVVRRLLIENGDDRILTVKDLVRDEDKPRHASGVMLFVEGNPQILLYGKENKRGLSLILGHEIDDEEGPLDNLFGSFIVMPRRGEVAYRHCLIVRERELTVDEMAEAVGIFTATELRKLKNRRHGAAFDRLKKLIGRKSSVDPMSSYEPPPHE